MALTIELLIVGVFHLAIGSWRDAWGGAAAGKGLAEPVAILALVDLIEQGADSDLVCDMLAFSAERMMDLEIEARTGTAAGIRSPARLNHRNGNRERGWDTRAGRIDLAIPKLRKGSYLPSFLETRRTAEKAPAAVIQEA